MLSTIRYICNFDNLQTLCLSYKDILGCSSPKPPKNVFQKVQCNDTKQIFWQIVLGTEYFLGLPFKANLGDFFFF